MKRRRMAQGGAGWLKFAKAQATIGGSVSTCHREGRRNGCRRRQGHRQDGRSMGRPPAEPVPKVRSAPPPVAPLKRIAPPRPSEDGVDLASMPGPWFHVLAFAPPARGFSTIAWGSPSWPACRRGSHIRSDVPWATLHVAALGVAIGLSSYIRAAPRPSAATGPMGLAPCALLGLLASIWYGAFLTIDDRWATGLDAKTGERVQTEDWQHAFGKDSATIFSDTRMSLAVS